jgi:hypothetical protein
MADRPFRLELALGSDELDCVYREGGVNVPAAGVDSQYSSGGVGVHVRDATVAFDYLAVYE